ncbi:threonine--tRNA ligase [Stella sp.]|uniref:threonine--tRNA ligase n=1 Tax=Stella sp. TaxID=2912054 RepID=UPI0035AFDA5C
MVQISLPDGSVRPFDAPPTGLALAESIGKGLAKAAVAMRVDGVLMDLTRTIDQDATVEIVTRDQPAALELLRHDAAHALAEAAKELYPDVQVTIGPAIENGFYYDFYRETPFTPEDMARMEERMREIVDRDEPITREVWDRQQAILHFQSIGEHYKAQIIQDLPPGEVITVYRQGAFVDLCRGPHLPSTGRLGKAFKLMKLAGAYWRGDHRNAQLQRVYGTAWASEKDLKAYLTQLEEAEKRDHRRLGREMGLFHQQEEAAGMIFWHPKGWRLYRRLEAWLRERLDRAGYVEVKTPQLVDRKLWEASGHWEKFRESMYIAENEEGVKAFAEDPTERIFALKPMNCPCHVQIFNQGLKSYRDLPLRMAEFGSCHRFEPGGALHGIMRVRNFVQDDAHIFCTEDQIISESKAFCQLLLGVYRDLGFADVFVKLADRPAKRHGSDAVWDKAEAALAAACDASGLPYVLNPGEGAFYGPKLEFTLRDTIGREWQCGTLQVDFVLPERLGAFYVGEDGQKHHPVMLHRAIFGSFERFIGILIEHYAGRLPLWLAPTQVAVATIVSDADAYAAEVADLLRARGLRVELDRRNEKINYKVREHSLAKTPVMLVVGKRETEERTASIRRLGRPDQETLGLDAAIAALVAESAAPDGTATPVAAAAE